MRKLVLWFGLLLVLGVANGFIVDRERVLASGETMLLRLAPRDPRSLLQGDYMTLRYAIAVEIEAALDERFSVDGRAVVRLDDDGVVSLVRLAATAEENLAPGERLLGYRKRGRQLRIGGDAYFFEEGQQDVYAGARYGELKVDSAGDAVLVGLRGADFERLEPDAD